MKQNYNDYIGKKLSKEKIFNIFEGKAVAGQRDLSDYPEIYLTIEFIGSYKKTAEYFAANRCCIVQGKPKRKGAGLIWESSILLVQLLGEWNTSVVSDGGMSNERMILKADGTGLFAEANMGPYFVTLITWYVERDRLFILSRDDSIGGQNKISYAEDVALCGMGAEEEEHFSRLKPGAYGLNYHRDVECLKFDEKRLEHIAEQAYDSMIEHCADVR